MVKHAEYTACNYSHSGHAEIHFFFTLIDGWSETVMIMRAAHAGHVAKQSDAFSRSEDFKVLIHRKAAKFKVLTL